jgi:drug/metabolite transporter (DMT)-like permease
MSNMVRGAIYGLTAAAIWGGMYVVSDRVLLTIPPFTLLTIRLVLAVTILTFILRQRRDVRLPAHTEIIQLLAVGALGFGVSVSAQFVGTDKSTAVNGALVTSAAPAFILIFAVLILREKLTGQRIAAVALATLGVLVIIDPGSADFSSATFFGDMALAVAAITWGLFSVLIRRVSANTDTFIVTYIGFLGGLVLTVPAALVELTQRSVGHVTLEIVLGVLYLGVISTALAMWLWNRAFALVDASVASLFFFAQPLVGAVLSVVLLGQHMTVTLWIGAVLITLGVLLSLYRSDRIGLRWYFKSKSSVETEA